MVRFGFHFSRWNITQPILYFAVNVNFPGFDQWSTIDTTGLPLHTNLLQSFRRWNVTFKYFQAHFPEFLHHVEMRQQVHFVRLHANHRSILFHGLVYVGTILLLLLWLGQVFLEKLKSLPRSVLQVTFWFSLSGDGILGSLIHFSIKHVYNIDFISWSASEGTNVLILGILGIRILFIRFKLLITLGYFIVNLIVLVLQSVQLFFLLWWCVCHHWIWYFDMTTWITSVFSSTQVDDAGYFFL